MFRALHAPVESSGAGQLDEAMMDSQDESIGPAPVSRSRELSGKIPVVDVHSVSGSY